MDQQRVELIAALRDASGIGNRGMGEHATPENLVAYRDRALSAADAQRVQDHLVVCQECVQLLLDVELFSDRNQTGGRELSDAEIAAAWQVVQPQLRDKPVATRPEPGWWQTFGSTRWPYALAASFLIVSMGLGLWIRSLHQENQQLIARLNEQTSERDRTLADAQTSLDEARRQLEDTSRRARESEQQVAELRQTVDDLSQPQINVPVTNLSPRDYSRGQNDAVTIISVPSEANLLALILDTTESRSYPGYVLDVQNQQGQVVWQRQGLRKTSYGNFTVTLARRSFPAGPYRLRLYGVSQSRRDIIETYMIRIRYQ